MKQKIVRASYAVRIADRLQLDRNSEKKENSKVNNALTCIGHSMIFVGHSMLCLI